LDTIRATDSQAIAVASRFASAVDTHTSAEFLLWACNRWLVIRLQSLSSLVALSIGAYVLFWTTGGEARQLQV
jgi:hypothetical protein